MNMGRMTHLFLLATGCRKARREKLRNEPKAFKKCRDLRERPAPLNFLHASRVQKMRNEPKGPMINKDLARLSDKTNPTRIPADCEAHASRFAAFELS
jgi:hypothetical protein